MRHTFHHRIKSVRYSERVCYGYGVTSPRIIRIVCRIVQNKRAAILPLAEHLCEYRHSHKNATHAHLDIRK